MAILAAMNSAVRPAEGPEGALEKKAQTGAWLDLRSGDPEVDSPANGANWGPERTIRAEALVELLIRADHDPRRALRLRGARIRGALDLEGVQIDCPMALLNCYFEEAITLEEATTRSVRLSGSHIPSLNARQLRTTGDLRINAKCTVTGTVDLRRAHIAGDLNCQEARLRNPGATALNADGITVDGSIYCSEGFEAEGEVRLMGARIGLQLVCSPGKFINKKGFALSAARVELGLDMVCRKGFEAEGQVDVRGAHIGAQFDCSEGKFHNPSNMALNADGLKVERDVLLNNGFEALGEVSLLGAHIHGKLDCEGGEFENYDRYALIADGMQVDQGMYCTLGFQAGGEVSLRGARIGADLDCTQGKFDCLDCTALDLVGATVAAALILKPKEFAGPIDLRQARVGILDDDPKLVSDAAFDGFTYGSLRKPYSARERRDWLARTHGYSPQPYEQLAATLRRQGHDVEARSILVEKLRRRRRGFPWWRRTLDRLLDWSVLYGYATWRVVGLLLLLWVAGGVAFHFAKASDLIRPAQQLPAAQPEFHSSMYSLDVLVPVLNLHQFDSWVAHDWAQWAVMGLRGVGWMLTTLAVLSLTGIFKRD